MPKYTYQDHIEKWQQILTRTNQPLIEMISFFSSYLNIQIKSISISKILTKSMICWIAKFIVTGKVSESFWTGLSSGSYLFSSNKWCNNRRWFIPPTNPTINLIENNFSFKTYLLILANKKIEKNILLC